METTVLPPPGSRTESSRWTGKLAARTTLMRRSAIRELLRVATRPGIISFAGGLPAPELFPVDEIRGAADAVLRRDGTRALQYGETEGVAELRDWVARTTGTAAQPVERANVMIVSGAQQALDLVGRVFLETGDRVGVESPTYLALLSAWRPHGVEFVEVPADDGGIRVDALGPVFAARPKLLYTIPNFQNPSGTTLDSGRRAELVALARVRDIGIVEDDPYGELRYDGDALPTLHALDAECAGRDGGGGNVIRTGTFSKVLAPGLRVGWVVGPAEAVERMARAKQAADLHTGTLDQHLVLELIARGVLETQIPRLRRAYRERRDAMLEALERSFPSGATWTRPAGGMFLMATLPDGLDAGGVLPEALARGVAFVPGEEFHLGGLGRDTLRLNFTNCAPDRIAEGIARLGAAVEAAGAG